MAIRPLIDEYPEVGEILTSYQVGCVTCALGTCLLDEVVKVHGLSPEDDAAIMAKIDRAINGGDGATWSPAPAMPQSAERRKVSYSPPVRRLIDEHVWIKRVLACIPDVVSDMRAREEMDCELLRATLEFIRGYADRFHHIKEEDILFDYTDRDAEIVQVILRDHERARGFVRAAAEAIDCGDLDALASNLASYRDLLTEHIDKEDDVLYTFIDRGLSVSQVGEVFRRFDEAEHGMASDVPERYTEFVLGLEAKYGRD